MHVRICAHLFMYISNLIRMYICGNKLIKAPLEIIKRPLQINAQGLASAKN